MNRKTCLILGSNSDLGQALAYKFAKEDFNIVLATRNINEYQKNLKSDIEIRNNVFVSNVQFDGSKFEEHTTFWDSLPNLPDVVISVFGYLGNQNIASKQFSEAQNIINSNYLAHVSLLNIYFQKIKGNKKAIIIGISSVAGDRGRQSNYIYGSAKAGFTAYLSGLRNEGFKYGIHVMTVKPGFLKTKMLGDLETPNLLTLSTKKAAEKIFTAQKRKRNVIYINSYWKIIMLIIKSIPEFIFKKLKL